MPYRERVFQFSATTDYAISSELSFNPGFTSYHIDATLIGPIADLPIVQKALSEFREEKANGSADPTDKVKGISTYDAIYNPTADTIKIGLGPALIFANAMALEELLVAEGYEFVEP